MKFTMKIYAVFLGALAAYGQTVSLSDTLTNAVGGGNYTGRITVTLNAPGSASPLYYSTTSLGGWQYILCVGTTGSDCSATTSAGVVTIPLYANSTITPAGTSYSARFQPTKGAAWSETWTVEASDTKLYQVRSTTVPTPTVTFQPSQLAISAGSLLYGSSTGYGTSLAPGTNGHVLTLSGGYPSWAASAACATCVVTSGSYSDPAWITSLSGSKVSGNISGSSGSTTGNAATATALAANGTNCSAGSFPLGVDASGNSETCTALPTTISGTANQITASASTGAVTLSLPSRIVTGANSPSADDTALLITRAATNPLSGGGSHAIRDESTYVASGTGGYASFDAIPVMSGSLAYVHLHSFQARPNFGGSTSIDQVAGLTFQPTISGSGTVTTSAGIVMDDALGTGPITTQYGLLVKPLTRGTGNYGVYVQGANPSYFGGNVQSGGTVSGTAMRISSGFTTYGALMSTDASGNFLSNPNLTIINGLLQFTGATANMNLGGTTSSYPSIRRNGAAIDLRLADNTGYANLNAGTITATLSGNASTATALSTAASGTPASSSATCTTGAIKFDGSYIYVCHATDTWKRAAVATW